MSVDPVAAVRAVLLGDGAVTAKVKQRVYGGELPPAETANMPRTNIVLSPAGGGAFGRGSEDFGDTRIDVICYGTTLNEAWAVYLAAYSALKGLDRVVAAGVLLHWARPSSRGSLARDSVKEWPTCYSSWQVLAAEIPAA